MPCVNDDGSLSPSGLALLKAVSFSQNETVIQKNSGLPLYRVRSGLRSLESAGLLSIEDNYYFLTEEGIKLLKRYE